MLSLNDASEADYAWHLTAELLDKYHPNVSDFDRHRFKTQLTDYMFRLYTPFVACFCQNGDLLSQWRGYGSGGEGFAVGFTFRWLSSLETIGFRLQKVIYDRALQEDLILMYLMQVSSVAADASFSQEEQSQIWQGAAGVLAPWVVMFKDPTFVEEQEWRLVNVNLMPTVLYRRSGHRIVPYVDIPISDELRQRGITLRQDELEVNVVLIGPAPPYRVRFGCPDFPDRKHRETVEGNQRFEKREWIGEEGYFHAIDEKRELVDVVDEGRKSPRREDSVGVGKESVRYRVRREEIKIDRAPVADLEC